MPDSTDRQYTVTLTPDEVDLLRGRAYLAIKKHREDMEANPIAAAPRKWLPVAESAYAKLRALFDPDDPDAR